MTFATLSKEYWKKAKARRKALTVLFDEEDYSDVIRESQELVELLLMGLLRMAGVDPPKWHDVSSVIEQQHSLFSEQVQKNSKRICRLSRDLRRDREKSFYGEVDFFPSQNYSKQDAEQVLSEVDWLIELLRGEFENE